MSCSYSMRNRKKKYRREEFIREFGLIPEHDDLERVNCPLEGTIGHLHCGVCTIHHKPRFLCGCIERR